MNADGKICFNPARFAKTVDYPVALYESLRGNYFTAQTPRLIVGSAGNAWGALYNPRNSGVNLHVSVATLNYIYGDRLTIGVNMNSKLPGPPHVLGWGAPTNTAIRPLPQPEARVMYASNVTGYPEGGQFMFSRTAYPSQYLALDEGGRFIVPPGGNYCAFLSPLMRAQENSKVYLAFGWWEEPCYIP